MANAMTAADLARVLSQANIQVSYSFWGSPCVAVSGPRGALETDLNELADAVYRNYQDKNKNLAMDYVVANFLAGRVRELYELADGQIEAANLITQFFIACRHYFAAFLGCFECFSIRQQYEISYVGEHDTAIPVRLVEQDPLFLGITPSDTEDGETFYDEAQIDTIYRSFLQMIIANV
ncbi:MAG: hypothetical protein HYX48_01005 [Chlamydiales bacterium]|nr:hypothetical protein [Chlamydiales bacterium]